MQLLIFTSIGFGLLIIGGAVLVFSVRAMTADNVSHRLREYVDLESEENQISSSHLVAQNRELSGSFISRIVLPGFRRVGRLFGRLTPGRTLEQLSQQLAIAGHPLGLGAREFYGIRLLFMVLGMLIAFLLIREGVTQQNLLAGVLAFVIAGYIPKYWLKRRVRSRQNKVRKGLPDALDMLSVCANAGLGFDQSLQRVSEYWKTPVAREFGRVVSEMEMGLSRAAALRNLSDRLDVSELSSFVAIILQSDELGMSIADTLQAQAKQMRIERRARAQEEARKIPLKMLFPMLFFIMPALFAVILGPIVPQIMNFFQTVNSTTAIR
jgi:tight adherence protein C